MRSLPPSRSMAPTVGSGGVAALHVMMSSPAVAAGPQPAWLARADNRPARAQTTGIRTDPRMQRGMATLEWLGCGHAHLELPRVFDARFVMDSGQQNAPRVAIRFGAVADRRQPDRGDPASSKAKSRPFAGRLFRRVAGSRREGRRVFRDQIRKTAPEIERARSRTRPPSFPDRTIHWPLAVCPVISPT